MTKNLSNVASKFMALVFYFYFTVYGYVGIGTDTSKVGGHRDRNK